MQYQSDNERGSPEDNIVMLAIKEAAQSLSHKATKLKLKEIYPHWDISLKIFYTANKDNNQEQNQILCTLFPRNTTIRGDAVIVTNGTQFDCRNERWDIDSCELAKTLWWYLKDKCFSIRKGWYFTDDAVGLRTNGDNIIAIHELGSTTGGEFDNKIGTMVGSQMHLVIEENQEMQWLKDNVPRRYRG
ncbi:hypothetical protein C8R48DRAFT_679028 [Suillus tomentosus]|nr:hypothetical protein C8R48DRAFT_679028 [Suillus tomentosus]